MKWEEKLAKQKALQEEYRKKGKSPYMSKPQGEWKPIEKPMIKPKNNTLFYGLSTLRFYYRNLIIPV